MKSRAFFSFFHYNESEVITNDFQEKTLLSEIQKNRHFGNFSSTLRFKKSCFYGCPLFFGRTKCI